MPYEITSRHNHFTYPNIKTFTIPITQLVFLTGSKLININWQFNRNKGINKTDIGCNCSETRLNPDEACANPSCPLNPTSRT